jgi:hypothetical protein
MGDKKPDEKPEKKSPVVQKQLRRKKKKKGSLATVKIPTGLYSYILLYLLDM